jgi:hypothetical protein
VWYDPQQLASVLELDEQIVARQGLTGGDATEIKRKIGEARSTP